MSRSWRWIAGALLSCVFAALAWRSVVLAFHRPPTDRQADLHVYLGAVRTVGEGLPLYDYAAENGDPFTYPPFALLVLRPLGLVPEGAVRVGWTACTLIVVVLLARSLTRRHVVVLASASVLLASAPLQSNLRFGQISVFLVLVVLADCLVPARYRGVLIGLAAAIKLTPLLFVPYLVITGQRRAAVRATAIFLLAAGLGFAALPGDSIRFWTDALFTTSRIGDLAAGGNQSVNGVLMRLGVVDPERTTAWVLYAGGLGAAALWRARSLHLEGRVMPAMVTVGCATVAISPVSWTHHQVWTVLAGLLLALGGGVRERAAGVLILVAMTVPFPEARAFCAAGVCCAGLWAYGRRAESRVALA